MEWVKVYSLGYLYKAEMIKALLEENEIECVIINKQDSSYLIGDIEIFVNNINTIKAKQIIENFENE